MLGSARVGGGGNEEEVGMRSVQGESLVIHISLKINFPSCGAPGLGTLVNISGIDVRVVEDQFSAKQM